MSRRAQPPSGPYRYRHPIDVRFNDTDMIGHVNNAVYLSYFEMARSGYYRELTGVPFGSDEDSAQFTIVMSEASVHYRLPAFFGEPLAVDCRVAWASRSQIAIEYRVVSEGSVVAPARHIADGYTVHVRWDISAGRVSRVPPELRARFEAFEGRPIPSSPPE
jgi:acyl-CoA thioester hydrolase